MPCIFEHAKKSVRIITENNNKMFHDDISSVEVDDKVTCCRCGSTLDIEDSHCNNCGALLREDLILL